jgi:cysteine desulfurase
MPRQVYLDHNATTPLRPEALEAVLHAMRVDFGNPSSVHWAGAAARAQVARARGQVASLIGVRPDTLVFTSGATESNNAVIRAVAGVPNARIVTVATEHPAILEPSQALRAYGVRVDVLPVDTGGRLDLDRFARALETQATLAAVMWVNNETGVIHPIAELAEIAASRGVTFHTDAVQALGKLPLDLAATKVTSASFSAHKLGGPKGVGALYVARGHGIAPLLRGGGQEQGRRPGTENVPGIAGFGAACSAAAADLAQRTSRLRSLRDRLWDGMQKAIPETHRNGAPEHTVPHVLSVSFLGADAEVLVEALDLEGIAVASGAACHSGSTEPSHVLLAMGLSLERGRSAIRVSLGATTTADDIDALLAVLPECVARVRHAGA